MEDVFRIFFESEIFKKKSPPKKEGIISIRIIFLTGNVGGS